MSLSQEPAFSILKNYLVCGYHDITGEPYAGMSGRHDKYGNAVSTTNGAGPHNIQMFILSSDGVVLTCLPGYWAPQDLVTEVRLAAQLDKVWKDPKLSIDQKDRLFTQMHRAHVQQHPQAMVARSHLQGFDANHEQQKADSDFLRHPVVNASYSSTEEDAPKWQNKPKWGASDLKTTDIVMHERMAKRPFEPYTRFDVAAYSDYGLWKYDKEEDARMADGRVDHERAQRLDTLGDPDAAKTHAAQASNKQQSNLWGTHQWGSQ